MYTYYLNAACTFVRSFTLVFTSENVKETQTWLGKAPTSDWIVFIEQLK